jgi:multiple sugar transport system substrate-binding protein
MKKTSRLVSVLGLMVVLALLLGCQGQPAAPQAAPTEAPQAAPTEAPKQAPTEAPQAAPTEAPQAAPTEAPKAAESWRDQNCSGVTIKVGVPELAAKTIEAAGKEFEEATGGKVEVVNVSGSVWREKMLQELVGGTKAMDVMDISPWWFGDFYPYLMPIDDYLNNPKLTDKDFDTKDIMPGVWAEYAKGLDGKTYGLPFWASSVVLYYRCDLFDDPKEQAAFKAKYGRDLTVPKTWQEWEQVAEFFTRPDQNLHGSTLMGKRAYNINVPITDRYFGLGAPDWLDANGKPLIYTKPELMQQAFEQYLKSAQWANPDYAATEYFETTNTFISGATAMAEQWAGAAFNDAQDPTKSKIVGKACIAPLPGGSGLGGGHFWAIAKDTPNPDCTWVFTQLMGSKKYVKEFLLNDGVDPARSSTYEDPDVKKYYAPGYGENLAKALAASHQPILNKTPDSTALWEALILRTSEVISKEKTPADATTALIEDWKAVTE